MSTPTPTLMPTPVGGGTGKVVFEYRKAGYENDFPDLGGNFHVFVANWDGTELVPLTRGLMTYNTLADVSPDGRKVLIITWPDKYTAAESTSGVYVIDLEDPDREPLKLASGIMYTPNKTALWLDNSRVVLVDKEEGSWGVFLMNSDGTGRRKLSKYVAGVKHYNLRVSADAKWVFWNGFGFEGGQYYDGGIWQASVDGTELSRLDGDKNVTVESLSPDGSKMLWIETDTNEHVEYINVASVTDLYDPTKIKLKPAIFAYISQILWSPDGAKVFLNRPMCKRDQSESTWPAATVILSLPEMQPRTITFPHRYDNLAVSFLDCSPDNHNILMRVSAMGTCHMDDVPAVGTLEIMNLDTMVFTDILTNNVTQDFVGNILWIP